MKCPKCKAEILKGEKVCLSCGYRINLKVKTTKLEAVGSENKEVIKTEEAERNSEYSLSDNLELYLKSVINTLLTRDRLKEKLKVINQKALYKPEYNPPKEPVYVQPQGKPKYEPPKAKKFSIIEMLGNSIVVLFMTGIAMGVFITIFSYIIMAVLGQEWFEDNVLKIILPVVLLWIVGCSVYGIYCSYTEYRDSKSSFDSYVKRYNEQCEQYKKICQAKEEKFKTEKTEYEKSLLDYREKYNNKIKEQEKHFNKLRQELSDEASMTENQLDKLYGQNIIHPQYRNIEAVTAFYNYISTGRCTALEGAGGAYNLYEEQLKQDKSDAYIKDLKSKISELETELKNKSEQERINRLLQHMDMDLLNHSLNLAKERISDDIHSLNMSLY